jgi:hypothetical protein
VHVILAIEFGSMNSIFVGDSIVLHTTSLNLITNNISRNTFYMWGLTDTYSSIELYGMLKMVLYLHVVHPGNLFTF